MDIGKYGSFLFGDKAMELGFITQENVIAGLSKQKKYISKGIDLVLGEIFQELNLLSYSVCEYINDLQKDQRESIDGYVLLSPLGKGGLGAVYKALQLSLDRMVALKIVDVGAQKKSFDNVYAEARSIASLSHPNIVSAIDVGYVNGAVYLAMEYVEGLDLKKIHKKDGNFSEEKLIEIGIKSSEALGYLAERGWVHRDIKPGNILINQNNQVKIIDLGLALNQSQIKDHGSTKMGVGTPNYISPEQAQGKLDIDIKSDMYALGGTLYYLATGRHVFKGKSAKDILLKHVREIPVNPVEFNESLSPYFADLIMRLLSKDPEDRLSPEQLSLELDSLAVGVSAPISKSRRRGSVSGRGRSGKRRIRRR
ncbi:MAG: hypothetical protein COA79_16310 [Planctomycetota bacterium]|nr:MAG: hypothetical protein COA79_16310 [Planctomycetota bacterium]